MPSNKQQTRPAARPTPKDRAAALRATVDDISSSRTVQAIDIDPVLAAIRASIEADAAVDTFSDVIAHDKPADWFEREAALVAVQNSAKDRALATVPTTRAGQRALASYLRTQMDRHGMANGDPPEADSPIWRRAYDALLAAIEAPIAPRASQPEFSACTIRQLSSFYETARSVWHHASGKTQAPWCWDDRRENFNSAGRILDGESERWSGFLDVIANEVHGREPTNDSERDDRLSLLLQHEMNCGDGVTDLALFSEMVAAWGDRARG